MEFSLIRSVSFTFLFALILPSCCLFNDCGDDDIIVEDCDKSIPSTPCFTFTNIEGYASPFEVQFDISSMVYSDINIQWDFGDGSTSTEENSTHFYEKEVDLDVKLSISNCDYLF